MAKYPTIDTFIICEDIRREADNKVTFVGVYTSGTIIAKEVPLQLLKFCVYQRIQGFEQGEFNLEFKLVSPTEKVLVAKKGPVMVSEKRADFILDFVIVMGNIKLETEGTYNAETYWGDGQKIGSFPFRVRKGEAQTPS